MDELKLAQVLAQALGTGVTTAVLLLIIWRVARGIVERFIASLDRVASGLAEHTKEDLASHRELGDRVVAGQVDTRAVVAAAQADSRAAAVRIETKLDSALDWKRRDEDSQRVRRRRPPHDTE
jgi:hypothetical protein